MIKADFLVFHWEETDESELAKSGQLGVCMRVCVYGNAFSTQDQAEPTASMIESFLMNESLSVCECVYEYECIECKEETKKRSIYTLTYTHTRGFLSGKAGWSGSQERTHGTDSPQNPGIALRSKSDSAFSNNSPNRVRFWFNQA